MNRKLVLALFVILTIVLSSLPSFVFAQDVGVKAGDSFEITYGYSGTIRTIDGDLNSTLPYYVENLETNTIESVDETNVTFGSVRDWLNGSQSVGHYWIDLSTGDGTAWLVIVSPNLGAGDMLYPNWVNENYTTAGAFTVNNTATLKIGGELVETVHLQRLFMDVDETNYFNYNYYWEKSTGILVKATLAVATLNETSGIAQTLNTHLTVVGAEQTFYPYVDNATNPVVVDTSSTILGFDFDVVEKTLSLTVTGMTGTSGYCSVSVPASFIKDPFTLELDGYALVKGTDYTLTYNGTHYKFGISYVHSTHVIDIVGSEINPEDPTPSETIDPEPTEPEEPEPEPTDDTSSTDTIILIVVAVVCVIGLVSFFALRKRK